MRIARKAMSYAELEVHVDLDGGQRGRLDGQDAHCVVLPDGREFIALSTDAFCRWQREFHDLTVLVGLLQGAADARSGDVVDFEEAMSDLEERLRDRGREG